MKTYMVRISQDRTFIWEQKINADSPDEAYRDLLERIKTGDVGSQPTEVLLAEPRGGALEVIE